MRGTAQALAKRGVKLAAASSTSPAICRAARGFPAARRWKSPRPWRCWRWPAAKMAAAGTGFRLPGGRTQLRRRALRHHGPDRGGARQGRARAAAGLPIAEGHARPHRAEGYSFAVFDTGVRHKLAGSEYNKRRAECEHAAALMRKKSLRGVSLEDLLKHADKLTANEHKRVRHVLSENLRVAQFAAALDARRCRGTRRAAAGQPSQPGAGLLRQLRGTG